MGKVKILLIILSFFEVFFYFIEAYQLYSFEVFIAYLTGVIFMTLTIFGIINSVRLICLASFESGTIFSGVISRHPSAQYLPPPRG